MRWFNALNKITSSIGKRNKGRETARGRFLRSAFLQASAQRIGQDAIVLSFFLNNYLLGDATKFFFVAVASQ
jgi:hypothetical protein